MWKQHLYMSQFRPVMVNTSLAFSSQWSTRVECPVQPNSVKYSSGFIRGWLLESLSCARPNEGDRTQDVPLSEEVFVSLPAHQNGVRDEGPGMPPLFKECALFSLSSTDIAECSFINDRINNKTSYNTHIKQPIHQLARVKQNRNVGLYKILSLRLLIQRFGQLTRCQTTVKLNREILTDFTSVFKEKKTQNQMFFFCGYFNES